MNHIDSNNHWKNELTEQVLGKKKCCNIKNVHFKKKDLKKLKTKTFLHFYIFHRVLSTLTIGIVFEKFCYNILKQIILHGDMKCDL